MKAAVLHQAYDFTIEDVPVPDPEPNGVVIKVHSCGVCGSDLHRYTGGVPADWILGHEFSGDIIAVGENVKGVEIGERMVAMCGQGCGQCYWCLKGDWLKCSKMRLLGYGMSGAFAEYVSVPEFQLDTYAARLPGSLSYEIGATAEPLSVALYAVDKVDPRPGDAVAVIGAGVIGLCTVLVLRARGIENIMLSGRRAGRLKLAKECGATTVIDAAREDIVPVVWEKTGGRGADVVFDCAGATV
ncbi:MAG: alcohol dehydrogenase catalytic domain-containing protein, partial [Dehalococcoidales bacterium]|nr:alcohol dehydrogenase catalytic domain-containing protein [Dehalococcoidales bacterium]